MQIIQINAPLAILANNYGNCYAAKMAAPMIDRDEAFVNMIWQSKINHISGWLRILDHGDLVGDDLRLTKIRAIFFNSSS